MFYFFDFIFSILMSMVATAHGEKVLVYCSEASPSTFNPQLATDGPTFNATTKMIYNQLVEFKTGTTKVEPSLAKSWKISSDRKTYTFYLRSGVQFHAQGDFKPSRPLQAEDVVFTFHRMMDPQHPYHKVNGGHYEYFSSMGLGKLIEAVEKVDPLTVRFRLRSPEAPFLANLAMGFAVILSAEYGDFLLKQKKPENLDLLPVGTGPFVWKSYRQDQEIRYMAFANYFAGKARLDRVIFSITPDASVRVQRLKVGECQMMAEPSPQDIAQLKSWPSLQVISGPGLNVGYLAMNVQKPPLDRLEVRQAISLALNRSSYIKSIYLNQATEALNPMPPSLWGYQSKTKNYVYDPQQAQTLLNKAGFKNGIDLELWTLPVSRPYNPNGKKMGEMMQMDLARVGIRVKLVTYDWPTYLAKASRGEHQLLQLGWTGDNGDPDNFLNVLLSCQSVQGGSNYSRWCDPQYDQLIQKARQETTVAQRTLLYKKAQDIFRLQIPWVPLAYSTVFKVMSQNVVGYVYHPLGTEDFYRLNIK